MIFADSHACLASRRVFMYTCRLTYGSRKPMLIIHPHAPSPFCPRILGAMAPRILVAWKTAPCSCTLHGPRGAATLCRQPLISGFPLTLSSRISAGPNLPAAFTRRWRLNKPLPASGAGQARTSGTERNRAEPTTLWTRHHLVCTPWPRRAAPILSHLLDLQTLSCLAGCHTDAAGGQFVNEALSETVKSTSSTYSLMCRRWSGASLTSRHWLAGVNGGEPYDADTKHTHAARVKHTAGVCTTHTCTVRVMHVFTLSARQLALHACSSSYVLSVCHHSS